jgi:hypothetical protein
MFKKVNKKREVKLSLGLINQAPRLGSGGIAPQFLSSALKGGEWAVSCPGRFNSGKQLLVTILYEAG